MSTPQIIAELLKLSCSVGELKSILIDKGLTTKDEFDAALEARIELLKTNIESVDFTLTDASEVLKFL